MHSSKQTLPADFEDVNGDGHDNLIVQIQDTDGKFVAGSSTATLAGELLDGTIIEESDTFCIVQ